MTITYARLTVTMVNSQDGFQSTRDFYRAWFVNDRLIGAGFGTSKEDAACDLLRRMGTNDRL